MYAVIELSGKQFRVAQGDSILVERRDGKALQPRVLMWADGANVVTDATKLAKAKITLGEHEVVRERMGRTMHFKPKKSRSNKRIMGHRRERQRITVDKLELAAGATAK